MANQIGSSVPATALTCLLAACGWSATTDAGAPHSPNDVGGTVTLLEEERFSGKPVAILEIAFGAGPDKRLAKGRLPWRHDDGTVYFLVACGDYLSQASAVSDEGTARTVTPCSNTVDNPGRLPSYFSYVAASSDRRRVAVEARWVDGSSDPHRYRYDVVVYNGKSPIARYEDRHAPSFIDDRRLIMASFDGLYATTIGREAVSISDAVSGPTNNPDLSPDGHTIVFEWRAGLWLVDIDGSNLRELATGNSAYRFPEWSPDGRFVAFLARVLANELDIIGGGDPSFGNADINPRNQKRIHYIDVKTGERWNSDISSIIGSVSIPEGQLKWLPR